ncbi:MAG: flagellin [Synergistota bacterium]|nr:flagellin [Synergistota bacterium]
MRINHNIAAMEAYRQLTVTSGQLQSTLEKLSSGLRINRAADDAAGLAISEKMRSQIRSIHQASRNAQDGISLIQTAEGALDEVQAILHRIRELAIQAANDTYTSYDREQIQKEIDQLKAEIDRIGESAQFNTRKLLTGELSFIINQVGGNAYVSNMTASPSTQPGTYKVKIYQEASRAELTGVTNISSLDRIHTGEIVINGVAVYLNSTEFSAALDKLQYVIDKINEKTHNTGVKAERSGGHLKLVQTEEGSGKRIVLSGSQDLLQDLGFGAVPSVLSNELSGTGPTFSGDRLIKINGTTVDLSGASTWQDVVNRINSQMGGQVWAEVLDIGGKLYIRINAQGSGRDVVLEEDVEFLGGLNRYDLDLQAIGFNTTRVSQTQMEMRGFDVDVNDTNRTYFINFDGTATPSGTTYTFYVNGVEINVTTEDLDGDGNADDLDLNKVVDAINAKSPETGVTATLTYYDAGGGDYRAYIRLVANPGTKIELEDKDMVNVTTTFLERIGFRTHWAHDDTRYDPRRWVMGGDPVIVAAGVTSAIYINGVRIDIDASDTLSNVIRKINNLSAYTNVKAYNRNVNGDSYLFLIQSSGDPSSKIIVEGNATLINWLGLDNVTEGIEDGTIASSGTNVKVRVPSKDENGNSYDINSPDTLIIEGTGSHVVLEKKIKDYKYYTPTNVNYTLIPLGLSFEINGERWDEADIRVDASGTLFLHIGPNENELMRVDIDSLNTDGLGISDLTVLTREEAELAISKVTKALEQVSTARSKLGAFQNRLEHTIKNLNIMEVNVQAAESRIRDADIAQEMMEFVRLQILHQSGVAMLAQANQLPQSVLQLLR